MYCMTMGILGSLHLLQLSNIVNTPKGVMSKIFSVESTKTRFTFSSKIALLSFLFLSHLLKN